MTPPSAAGSHPAGPPDASGTLLPVAAGLVRALPGSIAVLDVHGRIVLTNAAWDDFAVAGGGGAGCGVGADYLAVCRASAAAGELGGEHARQAIADVLADRGTSEPFAYPCATPDGVRWFLMNATWWSELPGVVVSHVDVTDAKVAQQASEALLQAIAHDLRGPLTIVIGMGRVLQVRGDRLTAEQHDELLGRMLSAAHRLEHHLENLTAMDRLKAGDWRPRPVETDVHALVLELVAELDLTPGRVVVDLPPGLACAVDAPWLERIVINLVANGVRHTPATAVVTVRAAIEDERLVLVVEDDGPGIPAADRERILGAFQQADETALGSGLGLSIVSRFTDLLDGELEVGERPGGGARFTVRIPVATEAMDGGETVR